MRVQKLGDSSPPGLADAAGTAGSVASVAAEAQPLITRAESPQRLGSGVRPQARAGLDEEPRSYGRQ